MSTRTKTDLSLKCHYIETTENIPNKWESISHIYIFLHLFIVESVKTENISMLALTCMEHLFLSVLYAGL